MADMKLRVTLDVDTVSLEQAHLIAKGVSMLLEGPVFITELNTPHPNLYYVISDLSRIYKVLHTYKNGKEVTNG